MGISVKSFPLMAKFGANAPELVAPAGANHIRCGSPLRLPGGICKQTRWYRSPWIAGRPNAAMGVPAFRPPCRYMLFSDGMNRDIEASASLGSSRRACDSAQGSRTDRRANAHVLSGRCGGECRSQCVESGEARQAARAAKGLSATWSHRRSCNRGCRPARQRSSLHRKPHRSHSPQALRRPGQESLQLERLCAWRHSRSYELTFCNANNAPVGSVTTAMVPSRSCGDGGRITLPPSASTRAAADAGSCTPT